VARHSDGVERIAANYLIFLRKLGG